jgi:hypothetical protein
MNVANRLSASSSIDKRWKITAAAKYSSLPHKQHLHTSRTGLLYASKYIGIHCNAIIYSLLLLHSTQTGNAITQFCGTLECQYFCRRSISVANTSSACCSWPSKKHGSNYQHRAHIDPASPCPHKGRSNDVSGIANTACCDCEKKNLRTGEHARIFARNSGSHALHRYWEMVRSSDLFSVWHHDEMPGVDTVRLR